MQALCGFEQDDDPRAQDRPADELLKCAVCGWQIRWRVYLAESEKTRGQLNAGHAQAAFEDFIQAYPRSRNVKEKVLAIDRLIHEFHWELSGEGKPADAMRTACVNLLDGTATEILDVLDALACSENSDPALRARRDSWASQKPIARRIKSG